MPEQELEEEREMDYGMIVLMIRGGIIRPLGFIKGLGMEPWTGM